MKSPRKGTLFAVAAALIPAIFLIPPATVAQDPPPAPVPKVSPDPAPAAATPGQGAQQNPPAQQPSDSQTTLKFSVNYVFLPVTVKDGAGRLVADLSRDEFRILDDNVEQRIEFFSAEAFPISAVILLDNDLKAKQADQVESSLASIVSGLSTNDEAFICRFDSNFHPGKGFIKDQDKLLTELHRTKLDHSRPVVSVPVDSGPFSGPSINGQSPTGVGAPAQVPSTAVIRQKTTKALDDAVFEAAQLLKDRGRDRRKIIFLISDGENGKTNTYNYEITIKELLRYGISVYTIGVGGGFFERKFSRLQSYAHDTGGDSYYAAKRNSLEELYSRVAEQARNQYTIGYNPRGNDRGKDYHSIEVRVRREGLSILTREGYYAAAAR